MKTITICNCKGGVGKTTTTLCLGALLQEKGLKVLYIDMDAQSNLTHFLSNAVDYEHKGVYELLTSKTDINELIQETPNGDIITSNALLDTINLSGHKNRLEVLKDKLKAIKGNYDYVLIDTPPHLSDLQINGILASDYILITTQCEYGSIQGLEITLDNINQAKTMLNSKTKVLGAILTFYNSRANINVFLRDKALEICQEYKTQLFNTYIRRNIALTESQYMQTPINKYAHSSNGYKDYLRLTNEILKKIK